MVSTRQMSTSYNNSGGSSSSGGNTHNGSNSGANGGVTSEELNSRFALVSTMSLSMQTQRSLTNTAVTEPPINGGQIMLSSQAVLTALTSSSSATITSGCVQNSDDSSSSSRHIHSLQKLKPNDCIHISNTSAIVNKSAKNCAFAVVNKKLSPLQLLDLPTEILVEILSHLSYKNIGQLRLISQKMNDVCMHILNMTFSKLISQTYNHFHAIKANMPRRESARRNHPLACECDIIETCYMRLSLLQMTFGKHIERGHCCFFPGAILDEVYTILHYIKVTPRLERPYSVTDELFDLSTMAMEYFRDRIEPTLPGIAYFNKDFFKLPTTTNGPPLVISSDLSDSSSNMPSPPQSNMVLRKGIRKIEQGMKIYNNQLSVLRNELRTCKRKSSEQGKQIVEQQKLLAEQQKQTLEYASRLDEMDKKNEEMSRKFSTLLQELNKCKTELQYWRSKSPAMPACTSCGQRMAPVLPPEDYQALINQGVRPEDILSNNNDDLETENVKHANASMQDSADNLSLTVDSSFPDEAPTIKLLAVNTANRNLKRQYYQISGGGNSGNSNTTSNIINTSTNNCNNNSNNKCNNDGDFNIGGEFIKNSPSDSQSVDEATGSNIITANSCGNDFHNTKQISKDLNIADTGAPSNAVQIFPVTTFPSFGCGGYSTKLFYGTPTQHKGVIVSPSIVLTNSSTEASVNATSEVLNNNAATKGSSIAETVVEEAVVATVALQGIHRTQETKKARRVQKATRYVSNGASGASNNGKRSK